MKRTLLITAAILFVLSLPLWAATRTVTNCADSGPGSLRQALNDATSGDEIVFDITLANTGYSTGEYGPGLVTNEAGSNTWFRIISNSNLPISLKDNLYIKGSTQTQEANNTAGPEIEIRCDSTGSHHGFLLSSSDNCTIEGLVINGHDAGGIVGIYLIFSSNNHLYGCYIGTSASGEATYPNHHGIYMQSSSQNNIIGGTTTAEANLISGNTYGVYITNSNSNEVIGNFIGTDINGAVDLGNSQTGVHISSGAQFNKIGDGTAGGKNVISGNDSSGISIRDINTASNEVLGNYIGTTATGEGDLGNTSYGVYIWQGAKYNQIGNGTVAGKNIISGNNQHGVYINGSGTDHNEILGNYIGLDVNGSTDLANSQQGVYISTGAQYNKVGNGTAGSRNYIAGNTQYGIYINGTGTNSNEVLGNFIGLQEDGTSLLPNDYGGIVIVNGQYNRIGSSESAEQRNIISGHSGTNEAGILLSNATDNIIEGNWVGLASDESAAANYIGILLQANSNHLISNIVSGNSHSGIFINNANTNIIYDNYIGLSSDGQTTRTNTYNGIIISGASQNNLIGSSESGGRNVIVASSESVSFGISLGGSNVSNNYIYNNIIGLTSSESIPVPRANIGILVIAGANNNYIGGTGTNEGNLISGHNFDGIFISGTGTNTNSNEVLGNFIGTDLSGTADAGNLRYGIYIDNGAKYNKIGNATAGGKNIISGNDNSGIYIEDTGSDNNQVLGNHIGTDINGTANLGNTYGILIFNGPQLNKIGDGTAGGRNIISGNDARGLQISGAGTNSNEILGNYIGTDVSGTLDLGNVSTAVYIDGGAQFNKIGNGTSNGRNIISGNSYGVYIIDTNTNSNEVLGNYVGTDVSGTTALSNEVYGVSIVSGASYNIIGGNTATPGTDAGNVISGNKNHGINISGSDTAYNHVLGNLIGTSADGTSAIPNGTTVTRNGVYLVSSHHNYIGNSSPEGRNIISGNSGNGIYISGSTATSNEVFGNYIGTDINGNSALGNNAVGIRISNSAQYNRIGNGTVSGRNIVSKNLFDGIFIGGTDTNSNEVLGNFIGVDKFGNSILENNYNGIRIQNGPKYNKISMGNVISGNILNGIEIENGDAATETNSNEVAGNYIGTDLTATADLGNTRFGIYVHMTSGEAQFNKIGPSNVIAYNGDPSRPAGVQLNGANTKEILITQNSIFGNYGKGIGIENGANPTTSTPEVSYAGYNEFSGQTQVTGESAPPLGTVEVFKAEGNQGKTYLGSTIADASGIWSITVTGLVTGDAVVATGTTANPETSEFSSTEVIVISVAKQYQPDNMIATLESGADYVGNGIYNTDGTNQTRTRSISTGESATYYIKIENDGNTTDEVIVTAIGSASGWTVTYYDSKEAGSNITSLVTGSGWISALSSNESTEIRMVALNSGTNQSTLEVLITSTSSNDANFKDVVKALTTATPIPPPPSDLISFDISAPTTAIQGTPFSMTITALDSTGATEESVTGITSLTVDDGTITPESIAQSEFINGIWTGNVNLSKIGLRRITATNGSATGTAEIITYNATIEITDDGVSITIPAGASSQEVNITVTEVPEPPGDPPPGYYIAGKIFDITSTPAEYLLPVTITIPIDGPAADARVYYWNGTGWSREGINIISVTDTSITIVTTQPAILAPIAVSSSNLIRFGPNPYNPNSGTTAKFWYWLNADAETSIYIVDMSGTLIWKDIFASGINGGRAGANSVDFDGKDRWGKILGNGVYIYKIVQGGKSIGGGKIAIIK